MVKKLLCATVSAALCVISAAPAAAQEYRFTGFDAPRGATATFNLRVPMGREHRERASYGLSFGFGQTVGGPSFDGLTRTRAVNVADLRFSGTGLRSARLASFDLANLDQDRRMNLVGGKKSFLVIGVIVGAVLVCVAADCFGGDDEDMPN